VVIVIAAVSGVLGIVAFFGLLYYLVYLFVPHGEGSY